MTTTLPRPNIESGTPAPSERAATVTRWHHLRRISGLITAGLASVAGLALGWVGMAVVAGLGLILAADAWFALRTERRDVSITLIADITLTSAALVLIDVPDPAIGMVVAYFVLMLAVIGPGPGSWPIGLYAVSAGTIASFLTTSEVGGDAVVRSAVSGILVIAVFGLAMIAVASEFAVARRRGKETTGRRLEVAGAIADASRVLVSEHDSEALGTSLAVIQRAIDVRAVFVERNVVDDQGRLCAEVVARALEPGTSHATLDRRSITPWTTMPGARAHLEGGAPFFYRVEESRGTAADRGGEGGLCVEVNVPIMSNGEWIGVVGAVDDDSDRVWKTDDLVLLRTIADLTAAFWQRLDELRSRDNLIGRLDDQLTYEEGLASASRVLLGEQATGIADALAAVGSAARADEAYATSMTRDEDGNHVGTIVAVWGLEGITPTRSVGDRVRCPSGSGVADTLGLGSTQVDLSEDQTSLSARIPVSGAWSGTVTLVSHTPHRRWAQRDHGFIGTVAEIMGAYYERAEIRARLEASLSSKDQLIGSVSHELRTPLTAVVGLAEELREGGDAFDAETRDELLGVISVASSEMASLIEDLLVAARSEDGNLPVYPERIDLALLTQNVVDHLQVPEGCEIVIEDIPSVAYGDPIRVRQVIRNLFTNAFRYGGPHIHATYGSTVDMAWVEIHDDGNGIPEDDQVAVFEPYGRARGGATVKASVGLGLTLSRRLARIMGGDLSYVDRGDGARFRLEVPLPTPTDT